MYTFTCCRLSFALETFINMPGCCVQYNEICVNQEYLLYLQGKQTCNERPNFSRFTISISASFTLYTCEYEAFKATYVPKLYAENVMSTTVK